jgi:hypothetical protein
MFPCTNQPRYCSALHCTAHRPGNQAGALGCPCMPPAAPTLQCQHSQAVAEPTGSRPLTRPPSQHAAMPQATGAHLKPQATSSASAGRRHQHLPLQHHMPSRHWQRLTSAAARLAAAQPGCRAFSCHAPLLLLLLLLLLCGGHACAAYPHGLRLHADATAAML